MIASDPISPETHRRTTRFNRLPLRLQAIASAALLLPTVAIFAPVARYGIDFVGWAYLASGAYFLAVLALVARSRRRRRWALAIAATVFAAEATMVMVVGNAGLGVQASIFFVIPIAYVAAWGIARRQNPRWWKVGLPLAAIALIVPLRMIASASLGDGHLTMLSAWLAWPGVVALGSAVCWAVDVRAAQRQNNSAAVSASPTGQDFIS